MTGQGKKQRHPQVLLLGNGINRAFGGGSWGDLIREITVNENLPEGCELHLPMPLRAILVTSDTVDRQLQEARGILYGKLGDPGHAEMLQALLEMGFDHILTTNFSYELEASIQPGHAVDDALLSRMMFRADGKAGEEDKYQLHTCCDLEWKGRCTRLWHIHGEGRKPDTMILGHYYYANLLKRISDELDRERECRPAGEPEIRSWADAFLSGDVYTLGFGYDVSEFDLWWLLNRKKIEPGETGETWFFAPEEAQAGERINEKEELLRVLGVRVSHCGYHRPTGDALHRSGGFREFYRSAMEEIQAQMALKR